MPGPMTTALAGAVVTAGQVLVFAVYFVMILFTFGLALFAFFIPLFVWLWFAWLGGDRLLPGSPSSSGRRWVAMFLSVPVSIVATWVGARVVLVTTGLAHEGSLGFVADLAVLMLVAALIGALCWSLLALLALRLMAH